MEPADIRYGTDLEFGQSIYEPFGIGQVEPLATGAVCCLSNVCGCTGLLQRVHGLDGPNVVVADYVTLPKEWPALDLHGLLNLGQSQRDQVEVAQAARVAHDLAERLPRSKAAKTRLLERGQALSRAMSWQVVVEQGLLPALQKIAPVA